MVQTWFEIFLGRKKIFFRARAHPTLLVFKIQLECSVVFFGALCGFRFCFRRRVVLYMIWGEIPKIEDQFSEKIMGTV